MYLVIIYLGYFKNTFKVCHYYLPHIVYVYSTPEMTYFYKKDCWIEYYIYKLNTISNILFRSESPTQAFLVTMLWLYRKFKQMQEGHNDMEICEAMSSVCLSYDNMCHMDGLNIAKDDLPLPKPFNKAWKLVSKVIDRLHLRNHVDKKCQKLYNPEASFRKISTLWHANKHSSGQVDLKR